MCDIDDFSDDGIDEILSTITCDILSGEKKKGASEEKILPLSHGTQRNGMVETVPIPPPLPPAPPPANSVNIPEEFPFPFIPYDIQLGFMKALYECLQLGKIGIFESPTGTGKSLSMICGAFKWLRDYKKQQQKELEALLAKETPDEKNSNPAKSNGHKELDWITEFSEKKKKEEELSKFVEGKKATLDADKKMKSLREKFHKPKKRKCHELESEFDELMKSSTGEIRDAFKAEMKEVDSLNMSEDKGEDDELMVDEYVSDTEAKGNENSDEEGTDTEEEHTLKIYYCSRTHSQLSQFVKEIVKSPYGDDANVTSLASRQNLCINEAVQRLKSLSLMNDRCLELQKSKKGSSSKDKQPKKKSKSTSCPFYKLENIEHYRDRVLTEVRDIEQLTTLGKQMKSCPYYGTRFAIPAAEIVTLPYNTLLHRTTRKSCGIKIKDNVVIIDEAHNLLETINNIHSVEVNGAQICRAHSQLSQYEQRYRSRLKAKNLLYINQILFVLSRFVSYLGGHLNIASDEQHLEKIDTKILTIIDFLYETKLDNINLFKVLNYCKKSQISKKLNGFVEKYQPSSVNYVPLKPKEPENNCSGLSKFLQVLSEKQNSGKDTVVKAPVVIENVNQPPEMSSPLMHIEGILDALTNEDKDGRMVINRRNLLSVSGIKFLLLNPAVEFASVVTEARAVIIAGGTMQPRSIKSQPLNVDLELHSPDQQGTKQREACLKDYFSERVSEFKDQLFRSIGVQPERIMEYSCGHVIPDDHLLPIALASGPSGHEMDFTFQSRDKPQTLDELGHVIANMCNIIPGGIVCFFPSYDYETKVHTHWTNSGALKRIAAKKKVFRETRKSGEADQILSHYSECIQKCQGPAILNKITGAILFSVVGGKMSEGINFSDELGRCVMLVGMPYPNINSPELKEKMDYLNANFPRGPDGRKAGQIHYENLCMKAVNQSIGRAIRHQRDYATVLLIDRRYQRPSVTAKLPGWIRKLVRNDKFGSAVAAISKFFANKKKQQP